MLALSPATRSSHDLEFGDRREGVMLATGYGAEDKAPLNSRNGSQTPSRRWRGWGGLLVIESC